LAVARLGSAGVGWERGLAGGAHTSVRGEREGTEDRRHESKRKAYSREYSKGWADWAGEGRRPVEEAGRRSEKGRRERGWRPVGPKRLNGQLG
jgi:hypothetical protein